MMNPMSLSTLSPSILRVASLDAGHASPSGERGERRVALLAVAILAALAIGACLFG